MAPEVVGRLLTENDLELRVQWLNEPSVRAGIAIDDVVTLESTFQWYERVRLSSNRFDFVFMLEHSAVPVAMGGLVNISQRDRSAELYVFVPEVARGRGIGYLSTRWLCRHAFVALELERVFLWVFGTNAAAIGLYRKLGFVHEGTLRQHRWRHGRFEDRLVMGLLRSEWSACVENG